MININNFKSKSWEDNEQKYSPKNFNLKFSVFLYGIIKVLYNDGHSRGAYAPDDSVGVKFASVDHFKTMTFQIEFDFYNVSKHIIYFYPILFFCDK